MESGNFRILLVEDQERHRKIYAEAITQSLGATVDFALDGATALTKMRAEEPPDMVLLDLEMPGLSGEEVLAGIRAEHRLRYTPVIILTGRTSQETQMALLDSGADDFIEKGAPPEILIARLKAQMRHKLAVDRLERLALDRDLFAAGVLQDIGTIKWTIVTLCRSAKEILARDPIGEQASLLMNLDKLTAHGTRLGAYANDVIQSVRETHRAPQIAAQDVKALCEWAVEVLGTAEEADAPKIRLELATAINPVLADKSFLRLAVLNIVQHAVKQAVPGSTVTLTVSQSDATGEGEALGRKFLTTRIADDGPPLTARQLATIFRPTSRDSDDGQGISIGLAMVAKVVTKMGGRVSAAAGDDGKGTAFEVTLPKAE